MLLILGGLNTAILVTPFLLVFGAIVDKRRHIRQQGARVSEIPPASALIVKNMVKTKTTSAKLNKITSNLAPIARAKPLIFLVIIK